MVREETKNFTIESYGNGLYYLIRRRKDDWEAILQYPSEIASFEVDLEDAETDSRTLAEKERMIDELCRHYEDVLEPPVT